MSTTTKLDLHKVKLEAGGHSPDSTFCVMELTAYLAHESWSDRPKCASDKTLQISAFRLLDRMIDHAKANAA